MRADGAATGPRREVLYGVNPVLEALLAERRKIERVLVARGAGRGLGRILRLAREAGIPVTHLSREVLGRKAGRAATHQGVAAVVSPVPYAELAELVDAASSRPDGWLLVLDRVVDPGNLGAVLRSAAAVGVDGVVLTGEGSAGLTPVTAKASAGALERVPVARELRPARLIGRLRRRGFDAVALDPRAETTWDCTNLRGRLALVAGGEERGLRPSVHAACNRHVALPLAGAVESLNVSVAVGVLLYEALRQRRAAARSREGR